MSELIEPLPDAGPETAADRPVFEVRIRERFGCRRYQVFGFEKGLLLLDTGKVGPNSGEATGVVIGGLLGGAIGGAIGSAIGSTLDPQSVAPDADFSRRSDDELLELARRTKHSKVAAYDEIQSVSIDAPSIFGRVGCDGSLVGIIMLRERRLGKVRMEVHDLFSMASAIDALPERLADRVAVRAELDETNCVYVRRWVALR